VDCATTATSTQSQAIDSTGWIPVPFDDLAGGSPLSNLPVDPNPSTSAGDYYYVYLPNATDLTFKLVANMESNYYGGGEGDVEGTDGGTENNLYEVGTDMDIAIDVGTHCYNGQTES
jgi:hypothetical protein